MKELGPLGIDFRLINFEAKTDERRIADYLSQISTAILDSWGEFWPKEEAESIKQSDLFLQIATAAAETTALLKMKKLPKLGLLNGLSVGKINYLGYCWDDHDKQVWVGLEEFRIPYYADSTYANNGQVPEDVRNEIKYVIAEEVFHAYIREVSPELAEENIKANASNDPRQYWQSQGEKKAKEFAALYVSTTLTM